MNLSPYIGSNRCVLLGFKSSYKKYLLYDMSAHKLLTLRDVRFLDDIFSYATGFTELEDPRFHLVPMHIEDPIAQDQILHADGP